METPNLERAQSLPDQIADPATQAAEEIIGLAQLAERKYRDYQLPSDGSILMSLKDVSAGLLNDQTECDNEQLQRLL